MGPARIPGSLSLTTVAVAAFTQLRKRAAPPPGSTRLAARASPLRMSGPWARLGSPVSLPSTTVAVVVFAPPQMRAAPPPGPSRRAARAPATSLPGARRGPARFPDAFRRPRAALRAHGPAGPAATPPMFGCDHHRGGRVLRPGHFPLRWGDGGERAPFLASAVLARYRWGTEWDLFLSLAAPDVLVVQHSFSNSCHPKWDKQVPSMKLPRRLTVSLSLATAEARTVLSPRQSSQQIARNRHPLNTFIYIEGCKKTITYKMV